jgi:hypothetical protein
MGYETGMEGERGAHRGNLTERDHLEDLSVKNGIILKWFFRMGV